MLILAACVVRRGVAQLPYQMNSVGFGLSFFFSKTKYKYLPPLPLQGGEGQGCQVSKTTKIFYSLLGL